MRRLHRFVKNLNFNAFLIISKLDESKIIIYQTEDGNTKIETRLEDETVWLSIDQMADLFQKSRSTVNEHIFKYIRRTGAR
jgi:sensor histidine kinase regulating citrate/malate metabolism